MYNSDTPLHVELPSSRQLQRSTILAALSAAVLLATVVLPAEYGIDPTGIGRVLRLTEMGKTKMQLAAEAANDAAADAKQSEVKSKVAGAPTSDTVELTRFRGHLILVKEGVHHAPIPCSLCAGISPAINRVGARRSLSRATRRGIWLLSAVDPKLGGTRGH